MKQAGPWIKKNRWTFLGLVVITLALAGNTVRLVWLDEPNKLEPRLDEIVLQIANNNVVEAQLSPGGTELTGKFRDGVGFKTIVPVAYNETLVDSILAKDVEFEAKPVETNYVALALTSLLPILLLGGLMYFLLTSFQGGGKYSKFNKKLSKKTDEADKVTFADVAGNDEAVEELEEIKQFLLDPQRFEKLGAKVPRGVILVGPPGTGKTLLARAVAGEANRPFFSLSGSDFVELFVGVGASRVRELFKQAREQSPSIIFIDELDSVGRRRGAGMGGGHDEREQTLNQLLVEMDGFDVRSGVIVIAATNRVDILDPALLRPGRFDRHIMVSAPDVKGRAAILATHSRDKKFDADLSYEILARRTPGMTGADLANLVNEAALRAAKRGSATISMADAEAAIDRVMAGPERLTRVLSEDQRRVVAYHESGHAICGHVLPHADEVHKVSIVPRGAGLGWTMSLPEDDRILVSRSYLKSVLVMTLGGRSAEEEVFADITTGASDDIDKATQLARRMVMQFGMSERVGLIKIGDEGEEVFMGRTLGQGRDYSDDTAQTVDAEVRVLIESAHVEARAILAAHRSVLDQMAQELLDREKLGPEDLKRILGPLPAWHFAD